VHPPEKFSGDGVTGSRANNRIHRAFRTNSGLTVIDPFNDFRRWEDGKAIKAAAMSALLQFASMPGTVLVGEHIILTHSANQSTPPTMRLGTRLQFPSHFVNIHRCAWGRPLHCHYHHGFWSWPDGQCFGRVPCKVNGFRETRAGKSGGRRGKNGQDRQEYC
jgi:hypothetical protein